MFTLIQEIQPYIAAHVRGLPIKSSNLAIISQLDIIDKHRMLVVAGKHYRVTHLSYRINESKSIEVPHSIAWRPLEEGAQIGEINLGSHVPKREDKVRVKAHTEAQIVFDETGYACDGLEVIGALQACISYVTAIVDEFELRFFTK